MAAEIEMLERNFIIKSRRTAARNLRHGVFAIENVMRPKFRRNLKKLKKTWPSFICIMPTEAYDGPGML